MKSHLIDFGRLLIALAISVMLGACVSKMDAGYGAGAQAEREAAIDQAQRKADAPDTPGMYLALIDRMQAQGLFYASLAHIDAFEKQYGATPDTVLLRADALRQTGQPQASRDAYMKLLNTPLAARGYRGIGLLEGSTGEFAKASSAFDTASNLQPTDPLTLSDLGYARLRLGDVAGARVPLMKAAELAQDNPKVLSNVALFLLADNQAAAAQGLIAQQKFSPQVREALAADARLIAAAAAQASRERASYQAVVASERAAVPTVANNASTRDQPRVESLLNAQLPLTQMLGTTSAYPQGQSQLVAR